VSAIFLSGGGCGVGLGLGMGYGAAFGSKYIVVDPEFNSLAQQDKRPNWLRQLQVNRLSDCMRHSAIGTSMPKGIGIASW